MFYKKRKISIKYRPTTYGVRCCGHPGCPGLYWEWSLIKRWRVSGPDRKTDKSRSNVVATLVRGNYRPESSYYDNEKMVTSLSDRDRTATSRGADTCLDYTRSCLGNTQVSAQCSLWPLIGCERARAHEYDRLARAARLPQQTTQTFLWAPPIGRELAAD